MPDLNRVFFEVIETEVFEGFNQAVFDAASSLPIPRIIPLFRVRSATAERLFHPVDKYL